MSVSRINKNISNLVPKLSLIGHLNKIPVVLTDSKGRYLKDQVQNVHPENKIVWWAKSGAGVEEQFAWLRENLQSEFVNLHSDHITLYIWLGTCDLTTKTGEFIDLKSEDFSAGNRLCRFYRQIHEYISDYPNIRLIFLQLPCYSIYFWNLSHGHSDPEQFREKDKILANQLSEVNKYIRGFNSVLHPEINSVDFGLDLEKSNKPHNRRHISYCNNFQLYLDGIHPCPELARLWVVRLSLRLEKDCQ